MKLVNRLPKPRLFEAALQGGLRSLGIRVKIYRSFKYVRTGPKSSIKYRISKFHEILVLWTSEKGTKKCDAHRYR